MQTSPPIVNRPKVTAFLSRTEAAEFLGVKAQTLAFWAMTGRHNLPFVKVGNSVKYRLADLEAWLASRTATSNAQLAAAGT
jgi:excisionase family DNA binding protein